VILEHLTTIIFLYQRHHPEDGRVTARACWRRYYKWKYIKLKCICWLLIHI